MTKAGGAVTGADSTRVATDLPVKRVEMYSRFGESSSYTGGRTEGTDSRASTLSLWQDLESVFTFVYNDGLHRSALRQRHEWFVKPEWPSYAMWWVADDAIPIWAEACAALEHLHDYGPTPKAFNFRNPFAFDGTPTQLRTRGEASAERTA